ncbi:unnamed protein product [Lymnaea stagnalis]|uniref:Uncharacterized protein n=1 Tax=Lymnaea stagnalis TaxID=6523 RepID=A0AAV2I3Q8_LYMST
MPCRKSQNKIDDLSRSFVLNFMKGNMIFVTTLSLLLASGLAQVHVGPIGVPLSTAGNCYHCDPHANPFPACLATPITCHAGEVCAVTYYGDAPQIKCQREGDCAKDVSHAVGLCGGGGVQLQNGRCELCCKTQDCVAAITTQLKDSLSSGLLCPGVCAQNNIGACFTSATRCYEGQFCEVGVNDQLSVQGHCKNIHDYQKCLTDQARDTCTLSVGHVGHAAKCVWDCCNTSSCLNTHFGAYWNTGAFTAQNLGHIYCGECADGSCSLAGQTKNVSCDTGMCSWTVHNRLDGGSTVSSGCTSQNQCWTQWWEQTRHNQYCMDQFMFGASPNQNLDCTFCCHASYDCNIGTKYRNQLVHW